MIIKWVGCGLLLGVAFAYSLTVWRRMHSLAVQQEGWIELLTYVRGQISCFGTPLQDILATVDKAILEKTGLYACDGEEFSSLCHRGAHSLGGEWETILSSLGNEIGTIWRAEQVERLDDYIQTMQKKKTAFSSVWRDRVRLHATLSVCLALAIILLVW